MTALPGDLNLVEFLARVDAALGSSWAALQKAVAFDTTPLSDAVCERVAPYSQGDQDRDEIISAAAAGLDVDLTIGAMYQIELLKWALSAFTSTQARAKQASDRISSSHQSLRVSTSLPPRAAVKKLFEELTDVARESAIIVSGVAVIGADVALRVQAVADLINHLRAEMSAYVDGDDALDVPEEGMGKLLKLEGGYGICEEVIKRAVEMKGQAAVAALLAAGGIGAAGAAGVVATGGLAFVPIVVIGGARVIAERRKARAKHEQAVADAWRAVYARGDVDDMLALCREMSAANAASKNLIAELRALTA